MPARITNLQRIINHLTPNRFVCDDCLSLESGVAPRQAVNQLCRDNPQLIRETHGVVCAGECRKDNKILRSLWPPQPMLEAGDNGEVDPDVHTIDEVVGDQQVISDAEEADQAIADGAFSRAEYLHDNFNEIIQRALGVPPADYLGRLGIDGLMDLKMITSNIHAVVTMRLTVELVNWLAAHLKLSTQQADSLKTIVSSMKPFVSGFDLDCSDPNLVAEVKGNIPVKGGTVFKAAQLKGLTNDVRQMFGEPASGKTVDTVSENSKIHRPHLAEAHKFLAVYDSAQVRAAATKWIGSYRKRHPSHKIEFAEGVPTYATDTVYVVFLKLDTMAPNSPFEIVVE